MNKVIYLLIGKGRKEESTKNIEVYKSLCI